MELLGPDGLPVRSILTQRRRLAVLLYLAAAYPQRFHPKDSVRALFWPDSDDPHARQALNRAIYVLRQALGADVVETHGDDEVRAGAELQCDVIQFHQALEMGNLEAAMELYRGDLAHGFFVSGAPDFEHWMEAERTRLRTRACEAAVRLMEGAESRGELEPAARWAHRAEVLSPYDERIAARRIGLLDQLGDRAAALRAFEDLQARLWKGLEVLPSPETVAHVDAIRARSASRRTVPPSVPRAPVTATTSPPPPPHPFLGRPVLIGGGILVLLGLLSSALLRPRSLVLTTTRAIPVTTEPGIEFEPALSPDGGLLAFARPLERRMILALRSVALSPGGSEIRLVPDSSEDQMMPSWSSDGERIRYVSRPHPPMSAGPFLGATTPAWKEVDKQGGTVRDVPLPRVTAWAAWSRDGSRAAFATGDSIFIYDAASRHIHLLADEGGSSPNSLAWSPDDRWIAYVTGNPLWPGGWNTAPSQIWLAAADGSRRVPVTDATHLNVSPAWLDALHLLFVSDRDGQREVYAVSLDRSGSPGAAAKVPGGTDAHSISVSADGRRLAVARAHAAQNVRGFPLHGHRPLSAREGTAVTFGSQVVETHDVSPDGRWLAYDTNLHGNADIYIVRLDGGAPVPLVTGPASDYSPRWSPDGREITYYGGDEGGGIWVVSAAGGTPTRLGGPGELPIWAPDGLSIVFRTNRGGPFEAWIVTRDRIGGPWSTARQLTDFGCAYPVWAPDGSGVICGSLEHPTMLTLVARSGAVLWRRDLGALGLGRLRPVASSADGPTVYLGASRGNQSGIWAVPLSGREPRLIVTFEDPLLVVHSYPGTINVTRDRLYATVGEFESDIWVMDLVRP
ncbi:MAG TPA: BTAD domain-containing putative transcriptional regulator [Gemmatimonadales bacterium]